MTSAWPASSVTVRVTSLVVVTTTVVLAAAGYAAWRDDRARRLAEIEQRAVEHADHLSAWLSQPVWNLDSTQVAHVVAGAMEDRTIAGVMVDAGKSSLVVGRDADWYASAAVPPQPGPDIVETSRRIEFSGHDVGSVQVLTTRAFVQAEVRRRAVLIAVSIALVDLVLTVTLLLMLRRLVLRPVEELEAYAAAVSAEEKAGQAPAPAPGRYHGELERLRQSITSMVAMLEARFHALQESEQQQRALEARVAHAQRLESVGRLAGGVAHDFNNILTVVINIAETLKSDAAAGNGVDLEIVDEMLAAATRGADVTRHLLAFARKQVILPVALDVNAVVKQCDKMLRRLLGEDVDLVTTFQEGLWAVRCDAGQLEQVLMNLAVNARDAMPRGGRLYIETRNEEVAPGLAASVAGLQPGPHVRLRVRDTGTGMTPEVQARAFEPFFTTKPQGEGTGLGLASVVGIVGQFGGAIQLDSETGRGTTFDLYFPRTEEPAVDPGARILSRRKGGTETVLVVEDDPQVRRVTAQALRSAGYRVLVARDGQEALETSARENGRMELLVTDLIMPGTNGRELSDELRRKRPELRVLFMSGYSRDIISKAGVIDTGMEFLQKPFTADQLTDRVRRVLDA